MTTVLKKGISCREQGDRAGQPVALSWYQKMQWLASMSSKSLRNELSQYLPTMIYSITTHIRMV